PDGSEIARAVNSLLIDRIHLGSLVLRAAAYAQNLLSPTSAANALLELFRAKCDTAANSGETGVPASTDSIHRPATGELERDPKGIQGASQESGWAERRVG